MRTPKHIASSVAAACAAAALFGTTAASATPIQIGSLSVPHVILDFDLMPAGPTSLASINAAFPSAELADLSFATRAGTGTYDSQTGGGRALGAADIGGSLALFDPPSGIFQNSNSLTIRLGNSAQEFGFEVGDVLTNLYPSTAFLVELFSGASSLGAIGVNTTANFGPFFVADSGGSFFDRVQLGPVTLFPANWVVPALYVQTADQVSAPEPTPLGLVGLGIVAIGHLRKKRVPSFRQWRRRRLEN
jgi:hypothetical protein